MPIIKVDKNTDKYLDELYKRFQSTPVRYGERTVSTLMVKSVETTSIYGDENDILITIGNRSGRLWRGGDNISLMIEREITLKHRIFIKLIEDRMHGVTKQFGYVQVTTDEQILGSSAILEVIAFVDKIDSNYLTRLAYQARSMAFV